MEKNNENKPVLIVFAAGRGSRMMPLTDTLPKPLISVFDIPLIQWNISPFVNSVSKIIVVIGYLGQHIQMHLGSSFHNVLVEYVQQKNPKGGTLDALRTAFFQTQNTSFSAGAVVINADDIHGKNRYTDFIKNVSKNPQKSSLVAAKITDPKRLKSLGVLTVDDKNNLQEMLEKPQDFVSNLANTGMYYFTHQDLQKIPKNRQKLGDEEEFITTDFILPLAISSSILVIKTTAPWLIISTPQDVIVAQNIISQIPSDFIFDEANFR